MITKSPFRILFFFRLLIGLCCFVWGAVAKAQEPPAPFAGVALSRFEPAERGSRFFMADSLELRATNPGLSRPRLAVGIPTSYAYRATTFGDRRQGERSTLSEGALYVHPGASVVVAPGGRFAIDVPIALAQSGEDTNLAGKGYFAPQGPRFGDLRGSFDLRIFGPADRNEDGVSLAGGVSVWLPTGSIDNMAGDEGTRFGVRVASAARYGWLLASARVNYMYRREGLIGGSLVSGEMGTVLGAAWADDVWTIGPELYMSTVVGAPFAKRTTPAEVLLGVHRSFGSFRFGLGFGTLVAKGMGAARARGMLSIEWIPQWSTSGGVLMVPDRDRDGVPDDDDACPDVPGLKDAEASSSSPLTRGCPNAPLDRDRDGIPDNEDACPDHVGPRSSDPKTHGCPDSDRDGIPDPLDACPQLRGDPSDNPKLNGCPSDRDGDGVIDSQDACPDEAGQPTDSLETNGCPPVAQERVSP